MDDLDKKAMLLEQELNQINFFGSPIGFLLSNELSVRITLKRAVNFWKELPLLLFGIIRHFLMLKTRNRIEIPIGFTQNYILLTSISQGNNYFGQIRKLFNVISKERNVIIFYQKMHEGLHQYNRHYTITRTNCGAKMFRTWVIEFSKIWYRFWIVLRKNDEKYYFMMKMQLFLSLIIQTQRLVYSRLFLKEYPPECIVTEFDKNSDMVSLILAAKELKIPTYSLLHGIIANLQPYWPMVADHWLVWGDFFKKYLVNRGVSKDIIRVTGAIQHEKPLNKEKSSLRTYVTLATNPTVDNMNVDMVKDFCEMAKILKKEKIITFFMVRVHPTESFEKYKKLGQIYQEVEFDNGDMHSFSESLNMSKVVVTYNSAYGVDSIISGARIVQYKKPNREDFFSNLVDEFQLPRANDLIELKENVMKEFGFDGPLHNCTKTLCSSFGLAAANNVWDIIKNTSQIK